MNESSDDGVDTSEEKLIRELRSRIGQLEEDRDAFANLLASTEMAVLFFDARLALQRYTQAAADLLDVEPSMIGRSLRELNLMGAETDLFSEAQAVLDDQRAWEAEVSTDDDRWFNRRMLPYRAGEAGIGGVVLLFRDVTEVHLAGRSLAKRARLQAGLKDLGLQALASDDFGALAQDATILASKSLDIRFCKILEFAPGEKSFLLRAGVGWEEGLVGSARIDGGPLSQAGFALSSNEPIVVENLAQEDRFSGSKLLLDHGIRSGVSVVLPGTTGSWGVISCHSTERRIFDRYEIDFLQSVANVLSAAIQREAIDQALRAATKEARARAHALEVVMEAVPAAVMMTQDQRAEMITGNASAYELTGRPQDSNLSLSPEDDLPTYRVYVSGRSVGPRELPLQRAALGETIRDWEAVIERADGEKRVIFGNASPLHDEQGDVTGAVSAFLDVTPLSRAQQERKMALAGERVARGETESALERLREEDRRKDYFLAMLGHELRNPLASIDLAARLLERSDDERKIRQDRVQTIIHGTARLSALLDDLLDITRITRGKLDLALRPVDFVAICRQALESCVGDFDSRSQNLRFELPDSPSWVSGDPYRLEQVITNILSNAARFTPEGGSVDVSLRRDGGDEVLSVVDDGIGLSAEALEEIFEPFTQVETGAAGGGGLGLGLTLVRQLAELHGGTVQATSQGPGTGTRLVVRLPAIDHEGSILEREATPAPPPPPAPDGLRLLLVDDNQDSTLGLAELLQRDGHEIDTALTGLDALDKVDSFDPEILILDLGLPDISGYEVVQRMAASGRLEGRRVIALSGFGHQEARRRSREAGIEHHLVKPVDLTRLRELLAEF